MKLITANFPPNNNYQLLQYVVRTSLLGVGQKSRNVHTLALALEKDRRDIQTDTRPMLCAFRRGRGQRNNQTTAYHI